MKKPREKMVLRKMVANIKPPNLEKKVIWANSMGQEAPRVDTAPPRMETPVYSSLEHG